MTEPSFAQQIESQLTKEIADQNSNSGQQFNPPADPPAPPATPAPPIPPTEQAPVNQNPPAEAGAAAQPPAADASAAEAEEWDPFPADKPAAAAPTNAAPAQAQPQVDPVYDKYKAVIVKPEVQFLLDQVAAGKSIFDIQKEITIVDFDKMSAVEMMKYNMERYGATPEDVAEKIKDFEQLKPWEQNQAVEPLRFQHKQQQAQKMQMLNQSAVQSKQQQDQLQNKINNDIQAFITEAKGKTLFNHVVTDDALNRAVPMILHGRPEWKNADGTPNVKQFAEDMIFLNERNAIFRTNFKIAEQKGAKTVAKEVDNASKNIPGSSNGMKQTQSIEEVGKDIDARYSRQNSQN